MVAGKFWHVGNRTMQRLESDDSPTVYIDGTLAAWGVGNGGSDMDTKYMTEDEAYGE